MTSLVRSLPSIYSYIFCILILNSLLIVTSTAARGTTHQPSFLYFQFEINVLLSSSYSVGFLVINFWITP